MVAALKKLKVEEKLAVSAVKAAKNDVDALMPFLQFETINMQFDFCPSDAKSEQNYIFKKWRKEKVLLKELRD